MLTETEEKYKHPLVAPGHLSVYWCGHQVCKQNGILRFLIDVGDRELSCGVGGEGREGKGKENRVTGIFSRYLLDH